MPPHSSHSVVEVEQLGEVIFHAPRWHWRGRRAAIDAIGNERTDRCRRRSGIPGRVATSPRCQCLISGTAKERAETAAPSPSF